MIILKQIRQSISVLLLLSVLLGVIYPLFIFGVGNLVAKNKAEGSIIKFNGQPVGSILIGQSFSKGYFQSRPSASKYDPMVSGGSNININSPQFIKIIEQRVANLQKQFGNKKVPEDLVFASGSGLDPHISLSAANFQAQAIAKERGIFRKKILQLINDNKMKSILGFSNVNVLQLNIALDKLTDNGKKQTN